MNNEAGPSNEFLQLEPGSEWRFELEADETIAVRVSPVSIEVFVYIRTPRGQNNQSDPVSRECLQQLAT